MSLCPAPVRETMQAFVHGCFMKYADRLKGGVNGPGVFQLTPPPPDAWHRFESHLRLHNTREGKRYKEWLLARRDLDEKWGLESICAGASLIIRDVVREYLRHEYSTSAVQSLDAPVRTTDGGIGVTMEALLPDAGDTQRDVESRELARIAEAECAHVFGKLNRRERVALLARELGLALSHPVAAKVAGCGRSVLTTAYREALVGLTDHIRSRFPREDGPTQAELAIGLFSQIRKRIILWGKSEMSCAPLFTVVGG